MEKRILRIFAIAITLFIIGIILVSGPANAFTMGLVLSDSKVEKGDDINFQTSVKINSNEYIDIDYFVIKINGPKTIECKFNVDGTKISGCSGITIEQISAAPMGYGYQGYNDGEFKFKIILNSDNLNTGDYYANFYFIVNNKQSEKQRTIKFQIIEPFQGCSLRASDGEIKMNGKDVTAKDQLTVYVPMNRAKDGTGSLSGQIGRDRFTYTFNVKNIIENTKEKLIIQTEGLYKNSLKDKEKKEIGKIILDKKNNIVSFEGGSLKIENMKIDFQQGCYR